MLAFYLLLLYCTISSKYKPLDSGVDGSPALFWETPPALVWRPIRAVTRITAARRGGHTQCQAEAGKIGNTVTKEPSSGLLHVIVTATLPRLILLLQTYPSAFHNSEKLEQSQSPGRAVRFTTTSSVRRSSIPSDGDSYPSSRGNHSIRS